mmetsp:Transcript_26970/g.62730  ORF Transcript_26970/g.62730 Transcript_26970/m.62730 type:complete len:112 (-) Transcript_26970:333-668(-)
MPTLISLNASLRCCAEARLHLLTGPPESVSEQRLEPAHPACGDQVGEEAARVSAYLHVEILARFEIHEHPLESWFGGSAAYPGLLLQLRTKEHFNPRAMLVDSRKVTTLER